jgi:hypothetical protein
MTTMGLVSCQVFFHHVLFEFSIQNAFVPDHFCKLYLIRYKNTKKPMRVLLKQILQYKVAINAKNSKCFTCCQ